MLTAITKSEITRKYSENAKKQQSTEEQKNSKYQNTS